MPAAEIRDLGKAVRGLSAVLLAAYGNDAVGATLSQTGIAIVNNVHALTHMHGRGRTYKRGSVEHQASAPGDAFATDTGLLSSTYNWQLGHDADGIYLDVGTNDERGPMLEFGTRDIAPRPTLRTAVQMEEQRIALRNRDAIAARLAEAVAARGGR